MMNRFRKNLSAIAPLLLICLPAFGQEARLTPRVNQTHPTLATGSPAPDFSLPGIDGKIHKLNAWVFGCSGPMAFFRVVLPMALPGIAAAAIFAFVISWNEVFAASVLTVRHKTLTAYLLSVLSESPLHTQFAGGFILIVPSVLFILLVRKQLFSMWGIANR